MDRYKHNSYKRNVDPSFELNLFWLEKGPTKELKPDEVFGKKSSLYDPSYVISCENFTFSTQSPSHKDWVKIPNDFGPVLSISKEGPYRLKLTHFSDSLDSLDTILPGGLVVNDDGIVHADSEIIASCEVFVGYGSTKHKVASISKFLNHWKNPFPRNYLTYTLVPIGKGLGEYGENDLLGDSAHLEDVEFHKNQTLMYGLYKWGHIFYEIFDRKVNCDAQW